MCAESARPRTCSQRAEARKKVVVVVVVSQGTSAVMLLRDSCLYDLDPVAIATAMRRSEILSLRWDDIDLEEQIATLDHTKNGSKREVPLTKFALETLQGLSQETDYVFPMSENAFRLSWSRLLKRSGITDLRFHDLRHEAISTFFEQPLA